MTNGNELEQDKQNVRRCIAEVWNGGRLDLIPELVQASFCGHHERNRDQDIYGVEAFGAWVETVRRQLPDLHLDPLLVLAEGDRVMVHLAGAGTYRGDGSAPGADRALIFTVTGTLRMAEGRIAEGWVIYDTLGVLQQLDLVALLG